ncbi:hypothetical protein EVAR_41225_1 [Eumeta japonica]|uniref:Uncharacterized protein n=1 Tax=Eumeta variegata TaxID=151549 RepID=A0A4C1W6X6_EUMVA|nr:hypothetical protein EVAR_41225_1 [Eumeta japonica]
MAEYDDVFRLARGVLMFKECSFMHATHTNVNEFIMLRTEGGRHRPPRLPLLPSRLQTELCLRSESECLAFLKLVHRVHFWALSPG